MATSYFNPFSGEQVSDPLGLTQTDFMPADMMTSYLQRPPDDGILSDLDPLRITKQLASGYLSGFSTLPIGMSDMPRNKVEEIARSVGHLGGFIGVMLPGRRAIRGAGFKALRGAGFGSAADAAARFRSIPMLAADLSMGAFTKSKVGKRAFAALGEGTGRQMVREGMHLGIASATSAVWEGFPAMLAAGAQGAALAGGMAGLANVSAFAGRDTAANVLRSMVGSASNALPTAMLGGDAVDIGYQALLGAYFGYKQPNAAMSRAQEIYFTELPATERGLASLSPHPDSPYQKTTPAVQAEMRKLVGMQQYGQAEGIFHDIVSRLSGEEAADAVASRGKKKSTTPQDRILEELKVVSEFHNGGEGSKRLIDHAMRLADEAESLDFRRYHARDYAKLVDAIGTRARDENMSWEQFETLYRDHTSKVLERDMAEVDLSDLRPYYVEKTQARTIPTFGVDSGRLTSFTENPRDFDGNLVSTEDPLVLLNEIAVQDGVVADSMRDSAFFRIVQGRRKTDPDSRGRTRNITTKVYELDPSTFTDLDRLLDVKGGEVQLPPNKHGENSRTFRLKGDDGEPLFYVISGDNNKDVLYGARFNDVPRDADGNVTGTYEAEYQRIRTSFNERFGRDLDRIFEQFYASAFGGRGDATLTVHGKPSQPAASRELYKRMFVSNVRYWEGMNRGAELKDLFGTKDGFIGSVDNFNKRMQPLFTKYYPMPEEALGGKPLSYVMVRDLKDFAYRLDKDGKEIAMPEEVSDGGVLIAPSRWESIRDWYGFPEGATSGKPFFVSNSEGVRADGTSGPLGALLGKTAFHVPEGGLGRAMDEAGVGMIINDTSAKQKGYRATHTYRLKDGKLEFGNDAGQWGVEPTLYEMSARDIRMDMHKTDKTPKGMVRRFEQLVSSIVPEQLGFVTTPEGTIHHADPSKAPQRWQRIVRDMIDVNVAGESKYNKLLDAYEKSPGQKELDALFEPTETGLIPADKMDKMRLYSLVASQGHEKLQGRLYEHIQRHNRENHEVKAPWLEDNGERELQQDALFKERGTGVDTLLRMTSNKAGLFHGKMTGGMMQSAFSSWVVGSLTNPIHPYGATAVMKPFHPGLHGDYTYDGSRVYTREQFLEQSDQTGLATKEAQRAAIADLNESTVLLEGGMREVKIRAHFHNKKGQLRQRTETLGEVWDRYHKTKNVALKRLLEEDMEIIAARSPMADISGAQVLRIGGFLEGKGYGVVLHHETMKRLGGADLDIDTANLYWNMAPVMKEVLQANRYNQQSFRTTELAEQERWGVNFRQLDTITNDPTVNLFLRTPQDLRAFQKTADVDGDAAYKAAAIFDPFHRMRIAQEVAAGQGQMAGIAVSSRKHISTLYAQVNRQPGGEMYRPIWRTNRKTGETYQSGFMYLKARDDNGALLRARANGAISAAIDVAKYGGVAGKTELQAILLDAAFERVGIVKSSGRVDILHDGSSADPARRSRYNVDGTLTPNPELVRMIGGRDGRGPKFIQDLESMVSANMGLKARNRLTGRLLSMDDRKEMLSQYPRDNGGRVFDSFVGVLSDRIGSIRYDGSTAMDYVLSDLSAFEGKLSALNSTLKQHGDLYPFLMGKDGQTPTMPYRHLTNTLKEIAPFYRPESSKLRTENGRKEFVLDNDLYNALQQRLESHDKSLKLPKTNNPLERIVAMEEMMTRLNDFLSNDLDDLTSLATLRATFTEAGLSKEQATELMDMATYIKGAYAKSYEQAVAERGAAYSQHGRQVSKTSATALANQTLEQLYTQALGDGVGTFKGVSRLVEEWNQSPLKGQGGQREFDLVPSRVRSFFDMAMLSSYGRTEKGEIRSLSRQASLSIASDEALARWGDHRGELFETMYLRKPGARTPLELITSDLGVKYSMDRLSSKEYLEGIEWSGKQDEIVLAPENVKLGKEIAELAAHYAPFRENPENLVYVAREMFGKAHPRDFSLSEMEGLRSELQSWRNGYGFFTWLTRKGGMDVMKRAEDAAKKDGREFNWWHTIQFVRTNADYTKIDDIILIDKAKRESGQGRLLRTFTEGTDGTYESKPVWGKALAAESHFDRLIDINGQHKDLLVNNSSTQIQAVFNDAFAWLAGGITDGQSGANHEALALELGILHREAEGIMERKQRLETRPDGYYPKREIDKANRFLADTIKREKRAEEKYMDALGIDKGDPYARQQLMDRETLVVQDGIQKKVQLRDALRMIGESRDALDGVHEKYISARSWTEKNLTPFIEHGELNIKKAADHFSNIFQRGILSRDQEHLPLDVARLFNYENEVRVEAGRRLEQGEVRFPVNAKSVLSLNILGKDIHGAVKRALGEEADVRSMDQARKTAQSLRAVARSKRNDPDAKLLRAAADYLYKPLGSDDMRRVWREKDYYSQHEQDMMLLRNGKTKYGAIYAREKIRHEYPLRETAFEEGYWPHLDHDMKVLEADLVDRIERVVGKHHDPAAREAILKDMEADYRNMLGRAGADDGGATDADAQHILDGNTQNFLKNARGQFFGSQMQRQHNWDGYRIDLGVLGTYGQQLARATYGNVASMLSRNVIRGFEKSGAMGEHNRTWANWMRIYVRDTMNKPSVFVGEDAEAVLNDPGLKLKQTPYYALSDHAFIAQGGYLKKAFVKMSGLHRVTDVDKAFFKAENGRDMGIDDVRSQEQANFEALVQDGTMTEAQARQVGRKLRGFSDVEAKYEMMALLFSPKSYLNNIIGGDTNTVAYTGLRHFKGAMSKKTWQAINPERFKNMDDVYDWVREMGVVEDFVIHEAGVRGMTRSPRWNDFINESAAFIGKNPKHSMKDIHEIAGKYGITDKAVDTGALFMRKSELTLRTRAFLAGYLQARESMHPMQLEYDNPYLIEQGRKAVSASQFLYGSAERPAFARTSLGKVYSRFKLWAWNSIKFRREIYQDAKAHGFTPGSKEFKRIQNMYVADMFMVSLASMFPYSMFENTLPPPFSWLKDLSEYFFGDEYDRQRAFFSSPLGPLVELTPTLIARPVGLGKSAFRMMVTGETDTMAMYQLATMFPFGRASYDAVRSLQDPWRAPQFLTSIPFRQFAEFRNQRERAATLDRVAGDLSEVLGSSQAGLTERDVIAQFEQRGHTDKDARLALREAIARGMASRTLQKTSTGRAYYYRTADIDPIQLKKANDTGVPSFIRGF